MTRRLCISTFLAGSVAGLSSGQAVSQPGEEPLNQEHVAWVSRTLQRMLTIKPGMTREKLLTVFTIEGGLSTPRQRTFVSRDCPYFKVDVQFQVVGRPNRDSDGRVAPTEEDSRDIIVKISTPYLQFSILD